MFKSIDDLKSFQKLLKPSNDNFIYYYLNTIYQHLLMREESPSADINEVNSKNLFSNTLKQKANEEGISLRNFLQYFDIQEFMCERVFKYLDKTKTGKLTKNEFVNGLETIFFGTIQELYKMAFFMCDFNDKGKIHKFNMKLILSYIPVKTYEEQQKYIKNLNSTINNYFTNLDKRYPEKNIKVDKEIDFEIYKNNIEDYINNKDDPFNNNNGAFLLFINLISYIYLNNPFNKDNMNYCKFLKNKFLMKPSKKQVKIDPNIPNKDNKDNRYKENLIRTDIKHRSNSLYISKSKSNNLNNVNNIKSHNDNLELSKKNLFSSDLKIDKDKEKLNTKEKEKINTKEKEKDKDKEKNNEFISFSMNLKELKKNKLRSSKKPKEVKPFNLTPPKDKNPELKLDSEPEENTINNEYGDILYKYCEEDSSKFIKKYYAELRGKDILFFTSKLKNELCAIWNISNCIIIESDKISISKYVYYPIKFINYNLSFCLVYFEEIEKRNLFVKKCAENIHYLKIEDYFENKEKIGEGHFGLVKKCIEKSTGKNMLLKS